MKVSPQNLFFLLAYAWDLYQDFQDTRVKADAYSVPVDLLAAVFLRSTETVLKRGIDREYFPEIEERPTLRGRLKIGESIRSFALERNRAVCEVDELSIDTAHNAAIRATLSALAATTELSRDLRAHAAGLWRRLDGVSIRPFSASEIAAIRVTRKNKHYELPLRVAELLMSHLFPGPGVHSFVFRDFQLGELEYLFQRFVRRFYSREFPSWTVSADKIDWEDLAAPSDVRQFVPGMQTDMVLRSKGRTVVIDTKFYATTLVDSWGVKRINSSHLYQLFAYIVNLERNTSRADSLEDILLYPETEEAVNLRFAIRRHSMQVITVNLKGTWKETDETLRRIIS